MPSCLYTAKEASVIYCLLGGIDFRLSLVPSSIGSAGSSKEHCAAAADVGNSQNNINVIALS